MKAFAPLASARPHEPELVRLGRFCGEAAAAQVDDLACQMQKASRLFTAAIGQMRSQLEGVLPGVLDAPEGSTASHDLRLAMLAMQAEDALEQMLDASICRAQHVAEGLRRMSPVLVGLAAQAHQQPGAAAATATASEWTLALQQASASLVAGQSVSQPVQQQAIEAGAIELF